MYRPLVWVLTCGIREVTVCWYEGEYHKRALEQTRKTVMNLSKVLGRHGKNSLERAQEVARKFSMPLKSSKGTAFPQPCGMGIQIVLLENKRK